MKMNKTALKIKCTGIRPLKRYFDIWDQINLDLQFYGTQPKSFTEALDKKKKKRQKKQKQKQKKQKRNILMINMNFKV